jgi:hypothetical protein
MRLASLDVIFSIKAVSLLTFYFYSCLPLRSASKLYMTEEGRRIIVLCGLRGKNQRRNGNIQQDKYEMKFIFLSAL